MNLGSIVEKAPIDELFAYPLHPYTQALLSAIPVVNPTFKKERIILKWDNPAPSSMNLPSGCVFHARCLFAMDRCKTEVPQYKETSKDPFVSCHLYD